MIDMKFSDIQFSETDYDWFSMMPTDEKIIFMYSLLLSPEEMIDFISEEEHEYSDIPEFDNLDKQQSNELMPIYSDVGQLYTDVLKHMTNYHRINIIMIDNHIMINSDSEKIILKARDKFFTDGFLIKRVEEGVTHTGGYKFLYLYELISSVSSISTN